MSTSTLQHPPYKKSYLTQPKDSSNKEATFLETFFSKGHTHVPTKNSEAIARVRTKLSSIAL